MTSTAKALRTLVAGCAAALAALSAPAQADTFPSKPIRLVVPFAAGSGTDAVARLTGKYLGESLGQPVLIENKPGANGTIAAEYVAKAAPDGYTLLIMSSNFPINPSIYANAGYDPFRDFEPVSAITSYMDAVIPAGPASSRKPGRLESA